MKLPSCAVLVVVAVCALGVHSQVENSGLRAALRVYDECSKAQGFGACLKKRMLVFVDRLARMERITLTEGVVLVRDVDVPATPLATPPAQPLTDDELEKTLPRAADARDVSLNTMLMDKLGSYISSRRLQVTLPDVTGKEISRGIEEGRGKMKKMMGMMMMGMAAKMAGMIPIAIAGLFLMAGKALMMAKIALLLSFIIALKKIVASKQGGGGGGGGGHGGGWQSSGGGGGGGWDKRSYEEAAAAQKLAYRGYSAKQ